MQGVGAEIVMVDAVPEVAKGQCLDLSDASFVRGVRVRPGSLQDAGQASIIVVITWIHTLESESRL